MLLNFSAYISKKKLGTIREERCDPFYRPSFERSYSVYAPCRPFCRIFAASLVPFDERIPGWMPAENIRGGKIIKIAASGFFDVNSSGISPRLPDILSALETKNNIRTNISVIVIIRVIMWHHTICGKYLWDQLRISKYQ